MQLFRDDQTSTGDVKVPRSTLHDQFAKLYLRAGSRGCSSEKVFSYNCLAAYHLTKKLEFKACDFQTLLNAGICFFKLGEHALAAKYLQYACVNRFELLIKLINNSDITDSDDSKQTVAADLLDCLTNLTGTYLILGSYNSGLQATCLALVVSSICLKNIENISEGMMNCSNLLRHMGCHSVAEELMCIFIGAKILQHHLLDKFQIEKLSKYVTGVVGCLLISVYTYFIDQNLHGIIELIENSNKFIHNLKLSISMEEQSNCSIHTDSSIDFEDIYVVCVKWGKRYNADYVNKLYNGVKTNWNYSSLRNNEHCCKCWSKTFFKTVPKMHFICYTDDSIGLDNGIEIRHLGHTFDNSSACLPEDIIRTLTGWWGKAYLFSKHAGLEKKLCVYFDLDVIIVNNVLSILNEFFFLTKNNPINHVGLLSSKYIWCELGGDKQHSAWDNFSEKGSGSRFNTSIMVWVGNNKMFGHIFDNLINPNNFFFNIVIDLCKKADLSINNNKKIKLNNIIHSIMHRFDHWMELMVKNPIFLNEFLLKCECSKIKCRLISDFSYIYRAIKTYENNKIEEKTKNYDYNFDKFRHELNSIFQNNQINIHSSEYIQKSFQCSIFSDFNKISKDGILEDSNPDWFLTKDSFLSHFGISNQKGVKNNVTTLYNLMPNKHEEPHILYHTSVVIFPRNPKPDYLCEEFPWIRKCWSN